MQNYFGMIALLGSGETSLAGGRVFKSIAGSILRLQMAALGWMARDTPEGQKLVRQS